MLDVLFYLFIYPIEWIMQAVLNSLFYLTANYGLSIIGLSIIINLLVLPLYYLAEHLKNAHQFKLNRLKPNINLIKRHYKGQERQFYLAALYKIYHYHPFESVKASLGLLLQIPFFFAAFHLLGNYPDFNGVSFSIISNLGTADKLLFGHNLLPILMTFINFISAYFYSKNMAKSDQYQLWGLSIIFLVLLYFESAALLLYWTTNNAFSLGKNYIEARVDTNRFKRTIVKFFNKIHQFSRTENALIIAVSVLSFLAPVMYFYANNKSKVVFNHQVLVLLSLSLLLIIYGLVCKRYFPKLWQKLLAMAVMSMIVVTIFNPLAVLYVNELAGIGIRRKYLFPCVILFFMVLAYRYFHQLRVYAAILAIFVLGATAIFVSKPPYKPSFDIQQLAEGFADLPLKQKFKFSPNIYYLVPDSYPSYQSFLTEFKAKEDTIDNSNLYQQLEQYGFKTYKNAYSNYEQTKSSMAATWMMRHHYNGAKVGFIEPSNDQIVFYGRNTVLATLINNGYHIYRNYSCSQFHPNIHCVLNPFLNDVGLYPTIAGYYFGAKIAVMVYYMLNGQFRLALQPLGADNFAHIIDMLPKKVSPKLSYVHTTGLTGGHHFKDKVYLLNNQLLLAIKQIQQEDNNAIIIVQSDHGSRQNWSFRTDGIQSAQMVFGILFAIKWPQTCQRFNQVETLTPVNLFRYVFACTMGIDKPSDLEADDSYQHGLIMKDLWNNGVEKAVWRRIENGTILKQPIKITPEDMARLLQEKKKVEN